MSHSPEPWHTEYWCDGTIAAVDKNGQHVTGYISSITGRCLPIYTTHANLERIALCVTALAGLTNEEVKRLPTYHQELLNIVK